MPETVLVSVIIPALNEASDIQQTIEAARRSYSQSEVEIVVADGGSTDGTPDLVPQHAILIQAPRGRGVQMNQGAAASHGAIFAFCHADSQLPTGWREPLIDALGEPSVSGGTFQTLILPEYGGLLRLRNHVQLLTRWWGMFGDQVQFMRRETFEAIGGYPDIALMEDVEMARALHQRGRLIRIPQRVTTSSRRFLERGPLRQILLNASNTFRYVCLGATPESIARSYRSSREEIP